MTTTGAFCIETAHRLLGPTWDRVQVIRGKLARYEGVMQAPTTPVRLRRLGVLANEVRRERGRQLVMLEIGSLFGASAMALSPFGRVVCVDLWPFGMTRFLRRTRHADVLAMKGRSRDVLPLLRDGTFDLVYIDGDHRWPNPTEDMRQAKRLVAPGGAICGDDLERQLTTEQEVAAAWEMRCVDIDKDYHPGVSIAVRDEFGRVAAEDGFWQVRTPA